MIALYLIYLILNVNTSSGVSSSASLYDIFCGAACAWLSKPLMISKQSQEAKILFPYRLRGGVGALLALKIQCTCISL